MRQRRKAARPALGVIEGGRDHVIDLRAVLDELREAREQIEQQLERERERAVRAEERAEEALTAERIAREEAGWLRARLEARQRRRWRWLLWRI
jgi:small-conductance mechanosensitive channel